jgi:hypothetical protein
MKAALLYQNGLQGRSQSHQEYAWELVCLEPAKSYKRILALASACHNSPNTNFKQLRILYDRWKEQDWAHMIAKKLHSNMKWFSRSNGLKVRLILVFWAKEKTNISLFRLIDIVSHQTKEAPHWLSTNSLILFVGIYELLVSLLVHLLYGHIETRW